MIQRLSLSSPLSLPRRAVPRLIVILVFHRLVSLDPPSSAPCAAASYARRSRIVLTPWKLSRSPPPLKHVHDRDREGGVGRRVRYPEQLSLTGFQRAHRGGRSTGLARTTTIFATPNFPRRRRFSYFRANIFRDFNLADIWLVCVFFYDLMKYCVLLFAIRASFSFQPSAKSEFYLMKNVRMMYYNMLSQNR